MSKRLVLCLVASIVIAPDKCIVICDLDCPACHEQSPTNTEAYTSSGIRSRVPCNRLKIPEPLGEHHGPFPDIHVITIHVTPTRSGQVVT